MSPGEPKQMMFTWAPGYDWELRLWESTASTTIGGLNSRAGTNPRQVADRGEMAGT